MVAIVVGGASCVFDDVKKARDLCCAAGSDPVYYVINDMIPQFDGACIAVTLHTEKIAAWLEQRQLSSKQKPSQVWAHRKYPEKIITHSTPDWRGSSGLFACKIAMESGINKILLCGVPMTVIGDHFVRQRRWNACEGFRDAWDCHMAEIRPFVRSFSGWTAEQLGVPTIEFLQS